MRLRMKFATGLVAATMLLGAPFHAFAEEGTPSDPPSSAETETTAITAVSGFSAGSKPVNQTTYAWGWVSPAQAGVQVQTEVLLSNGWSRSQVGASASDGYFALPLTYGSNKPGSYTWRVSATLDGTTVYSSPFTLNRVATVTAYSAGTKPLNQTTYTWGTVSGAAAGTSVWSEVLIGGNWSRSQTRDAGSNGSFSIPLTYGASTPGTHTWRVGASVGGAVVHSQPFTLTRTGSVTAYSAGTKYVGETTYTWGTVSGAPSGASAWTEVIIGGSWSRSQTRTTGSNGSFSIPLTYGANTPGTYTWRVGASVGGTTIHSQPFTLTRLARPTNSVYSPTVCDAVRGNISSSGEKIYHMPGDRYYDATVIDYSAGERCFRTASEAEAAGWRRAKV